MNVQYLFRKEFLLPDELVVIAGTCCWGCLGLLDDDDEAKPVGGDVKAIEGICAVEVMIVDSDEIQLLIDVIQSFISGSSFA